MAANKDDENDSDVELEGMDLEGDDGDADDSADVDMEEPSAETEPETEATEKLAHDDQDELEAAHRERKELMAAEQKKAASQFNETGMSNATMQQKLQYLISQSDVFAHFLAGSVAATQKKGSKKKGSRGKKNRMTEAEEDAQLLKTAESKRSVIRLNKQVRIVWSILQYPPNCNVCTVFGIVETVFLTLFSSVAFHSLRVWPVTVRCMDTN